MEPLSDEIWVDYIEGECTELTARRLRDRLVESSKERRIVRELSLIRDCLESSQGQELPIDDAYYEKLSSSILSAIFVDDVLSGSQTTAKGRVER